MNFYDSLIVGLTKSANIVANKLRDKVRSDEHLPDVIADATSIGTVNVSADRGEISIIIDLKKAPMAAAFEWGSGIHSTKGAAGLYPIAAKNAPNLSFWWERGNKWFIGQRLPYGHPGVAPNPYIKPALLESMPEIKKILGQEVKASILIGIKEMFKT